MAELGMMYFSDEDDADDADAAFFDAAGFSRSDVETARKVGLIMFVTKVKHCYFRFSLTQFIHVCYERLLMCALV